MNDFILYSFKSAIWIMVFYGIYRFFLRNETFLRFNRAFLLAGMAASFALALCQFRYPVEIMNPVLVNNTLKVPVFAFTNSFAYYHKFKRITIMKKNVSKPAKKWAVLLLLPALAAFLAAFAQPEYHYSIILSSQLEPEKPVVQDTVTKTTHFKTVTASPKPTKESAKKVANQVIVKDKTNEPTENTDSTKNKQVTFSTDNWGKADSPLIIVDGEEYTSSPNDADNIESVAVLKDKSATSIYGEKGKNGVVIITMKKRY